ncbi:MAG: ATP-binding protein [Deltaproteobacteria bacterium]|nr:ATP-binding protein [Deltaproteobacteria bacterium]
MNFTKKPVKFSLKDIGSKLIDQLSTDIYSDPGAILRELVKNAYDAYLDPELDDLDAKSVNRQILISRHRDIRGIGHFLVADKGVGQTLEDLKGNVQISISRKSEELENATGFRGLGSWSVLGAGSKITITSSKKGTPYEVRLTIDVKRIYSILAPGTGLDEILNNPSCIYFEQRPCASEDLGTTVDIECDGPPRSISGHELNRLYTYTDPEEKTLRDLIVEFCPIPFAADGSVYEKIHEIYRRINYKPTSLYLDGKLLERRIPSMLSNVITEELYIGTQLSGIAWVAEDPSRTGEIAKLIEKETHLLNGPSVQLLKLNVPIGKKGLFDDNVRQFILNWYVGEVHIVSPDVKPSANGQDLRGGTGRESFIERLRIFYKKLEEKSEAKSIKLSIIKNFLKAKEAATKLGTGSISVAEKLDEEGKILKAVNLMRVKKGKPKSTTEQRTREALRDPEVSKIKNETYEVLKTGGYIDLFAKTSKDSNGGRKKNTSKRARLSAVQNIRQNNNIISMEEFQARVGRFIPQLQELGLTQQQVESVLSIIQQLFTGESGTDSSPDNYGEIQRERN